MLRAVSEWMGWAALAVAVLLFVYPPPWLTKRLRAFDNAFARVQTLTAQPDILPKTVGEALRHAYPPEVVKGWLHDELVWVLAEGGPGQELVELGAETAGRVVAEQAVGMLASMKKPEVANAMREKGLATRRNLPLAGGIGKMATDAGLLDGLGGLASLLPPEAIQGLVAQFLSGMGSKGGNGGAVGYGQQQQALPAWRPPY